MSKEMSKDLKRGRPLVGITMRQELETERFYLARFYSEAVEASGGAPLHIPLIPNASYLEEVVGRLDALLLPGSASDVDPALYGREPHARLGAVHPLRDATDLCVLRAAEERRLPLLAICYGMQVWNVYRGGTLIQDIESQVQGALKHEQGAPRERHSHGIKIKPDSLVARMAGGEELRVNSHHHQALETIGRNLQATAWSADGLVEAVEEINEGPWAVGVQWHPELGRQGDDFSLALFESFISAARGRASDNE
jgi:putative glutamine amidotransferase